MIERVLAFGDDYGVPMLLRHGLGNKLVGIVGASIRPHQHAVLRALAAEASVALLIQPKRDESDYGEFLACVRGLAPDFLIVNSYSMRLRSDLLGIAAKGGINVHGGLLPQYRGANPVQWALLNDERETGVTMHVLADEIDAGPIIAQRRLPILFEDTWREVQMRIAEATDALLAESLREVLSGKAMPTRQDEARARHFPRRRPDDGRIDWSARVLDIYNLIRALVHPLPGAYYEVEETRVTIDRYLAIPEVLALKYSQSGIGPVTAPGVRLCPVRPGETGPSLLTAVPKGRPSSVNLSQPPLENNIVLFRVVSAERGISLGMAGLGPIDWDGRVAKVGVRLDSPTGDPGVPSAVERALTTFAREQLGLTVSLCPEDAIGQASNG